VGNLTVTTYVDKASLREAHKVRMLFKLLGWDKMEEELMLRMSEYMPEKIL
jgi:hypothetical protein